MINEKAILVLNLWWNPILESTLTQNHLQNDS